MNGTETSRMAWFACGLVGGLMISYFWPSEPALAVDRDAGGSKFMIETVRTGVVNSSDAVFVLDFLTGRLFGASVNPQTRKFNQFYFRSILPDFELAPDSRPSFVMSSGLLNIATRGASLKQPSQGGLFIAELTSGKVVAYAFPYTMNPRMEAPEPISIVDSFQFRQAVQ
ncbi:MAG: hypothetical protein KDA78_04495 [Planctomycetaceae bacterium]|nr:hypothetical protein [Planctomycetaceae bacterium]